MKFMTTDAVTLGHYKANTICFFEQEKTKKNNLVAYLEKVDLI